MDRIKLSIIAEDFYSGTITEKEAHTLLLELMAEYRVKNCNTPAVITRLSLIEIENVVCLLHSEDWEFGNSPKRCEELKEETRKKIGYSKSDLANYENI